MALPLNTVDAITGNPSGDRVSDMGIPPPCRRRSVVDVEHVASSHRILHMSVERV
jgi:hypothetical protein